ncbi:MAG: beta/gamma crystallin-related protein [Casimicrobiaceae bacterium]
MNKTLTTLLGIAGLLAASHAAAQVTFYENEGFRGRSFSTDRPVGNFERFGFNDRAASAIVEGGTWEVCEDSRFSGRCAVLQPGRYDSLSRMGLNYQVSSVRPTDQAAARVDDRRGYVTRDAEYRRRDGERLFQADVVDVRAVVGPPGQRCWVEQQQVVEERRDNNASVGGAIAGAVLGGILGHQIGGGRGKDVATAAGAVGGAALGSNIARGSDDGGRVVSTQEVQRCSAVPKDRPDYYEVTYRWDGQEHRVQMAAPPGGGTIPVNARGEPRI